MVEMISGESNSTEGAQTAPVVKTLVSRKGYFPLKDVKKHELFVLIDTGNLNKPFLFHYDWSQRQRQERLKLVTGIAYKNFRTANIELKNSSPKTLYSPPLWMNKWKDISLKFESDCKFQANEKTSYTLTCRNSSKTATDNSWTQEIATNDITFSS